MPRYTAPFNRYGHGIKTCSCVSVAKKDVRHTCELFTGTIKSLILAPHISKTTGPIFTKFTFFMLYIYTTLHIKFHRN